jgi:hypothetical protein
MRKYHLVLAGGKERDVTADNVNLTGTGALQLTNTAGDLVVCYAPGAWLMVEVEARDDRGGEELVVESTGKKKAATK